MQVGDVVQWLNWVGVVLSVWSANGVDLVTVDVDGCRWVWQASNCTVVQHVEVHDVTQF
jgi:hypothetical protein